MVKAANKTTLGLHLPTDPRWVNLASENIQDILTDHAFCEQKAASMIISLIQKHSDKPHLVKTLSPVVTEEWGHFREVLRMLENHGFSHGAQRPDLYVKELYKIRGREAGAEPFLDTLLICALIEARSCERFKKLSQELEDEELRKFYHRFMVAEAGHYRLFLELAEYYFNEDRTRLRWEFILKYEASFIVKLPVQGTRMH